MRDEKLTSIRLDREPTKPSGRPSTNPWDQLATEYDRWFDSQDGEAIFRVELACVRTILGEANGRWLEVGVGTGRFASALGIGEGIDPSMPALILARNRGIGVRQGTAECLPYSDRTLDGILLVATLSFVADPQIAMREFHRALKPGGRLVAGMVPAESPWGRLYAEKGKHGHPFYSTAILHTVSEATCLAAKAGFVFRRASSCLFTPPDAATTERIDAGVTDGAGFVCLEFSAE